MSIRTGTEHDREIGARIARTRRAQGIAAGDMAGILGIPHALMEDYEAGRYPMGAARLAELATRLGVSVATFTTCCG